MCTHHPTSSCGKCLCHLIGLLNYVSNSKFARKLTLLTFESNCVREFIHTLGCPWAVAECVPNLLQRLLLGGSHESAIAPVGAVLFVVDDVPVSFHVIGVYDAQHSISSSWIRKLLVSPSVSSHTLSNHTPWSLGAPCTWDASNPLSCSASTARSHCSCVMIGCFCIRHILRHAPCRQGWWGGGTPQCGCTPCRCRFRSS